MLSHVAGCEVGWLRFQTKCYMFSHTSASWAEAEVFFSIIITTDRIVLSCILKNRLTI